MPDKTLEEIRFELEVTLGLRPPGSKFEPESQPKKKKKKKKRKLDAWEEALEFQEMLEEDGPWPTGAWQCPSCTAPIHEGCKKCQDCGYRIRCWMFCEWCNKNQPIVLAPIRFTGFLRGFLTCFQQSYADDYYCAHCHRHVKTNYLAGP